MSTMAGTGGVSSGIGWVLLDGGWQVFACIEDDDREPRSVFHKVLDDGLVLAEPFPERLRMGSSDDDLAHAIFLDEPEDGIGDILPFIGENHGPQFLGQGQGLRKVALGLGINDRGFLGRRLDIDRIPVAVEFSGEAGAVAQQFFAVGAVRAQADQDLVRRRSAFVPLFFTPPQIDLGSELTKSHLPEFFQV